MFRCQSRNLPSDQQNRLHPAFLANEKAYREMHGDLLARYGGQWVAVHDKKVIASGEDLLSVSQAALALGGHPFIASVGAEDEVVFRIRKDSESAVVVFDRPEGDNSLGQ